MGLEATRLVAEIILSHSHIDTSVGYRRGAATVYPLA